jgi:hypothetical protein
MIFIVRAKYKGDILWNEEFKTHEQAFDYFYAHAQYMCKTAGKDYAFTYEESNPCVTLKEIEIIESK